MASTLKRKLKKYQQRDPKILLWDIETSLLLGAFFRQWDMSVPYTMVFQEWFIISAQYKWLNESKTHVIALTDKDNSKRFKRDFSDDYLITKKLRDLLDEADMVVHFNGNHFDWMKFKAKMIYHKLKPCRRPKMIDLFLEAKSSKFTSNKMGDLCDYLGLKNKKATHKTGEWLLATLPYGTFRKGRQVIKVNKKNKRGAINHIAHEYGLYDIPSMQDFYLAIRPYMHRHVNMNGFYIDGIDRCTNCASSDLSPHGQNGHGKKQYICNNCGKKMVSRLPIKHANLTSA